MLSGNAVRLTVYVGEGDRWHHHPLSTEIVQRAQRAGLAGATVVRGVEGFGASSHVHTQRLVSLSDDLPVVVVLVDTAERIDGFLPTLAEVAAGALVVREEVQAVDLASMAEPAPGTGPEPGTGAGP